MMILADIILSVIGLLALFVASITDLNKKEVPDWLSFSMIGSALGIRLVYSVSSSDYWYFIYGLLGFGIMLSLGLLLYYGRLWGGGDAKLLMGLGALFATKPFFIDADYPFLAILLLNIIIVGSLYSLVYAFILFFRNVRRTLSELKCQSARMRMARIIYFAASLVSLGIFFFAGNRFFKSLSLSLAVFFMVYIHLIIFIRAVEKVGMYKMVPVSQLAEGDWVAEDIKVHGKLVCSRKSLGIENRQIHALRKSGIKRVLVKEGVAFVPSFFIGLVATLVFGSFLL